MSRPKQLLITYISTYQKDRILISFACYYGASLKKSLLDFKDGKFRSSNHFWCDYNDDVRTIFCQNSTSFSLQPDEKKWAKKVQI